MKKNNQPSSTAMTVLQGILYKAQEPEYSHLVSKETREVSTQILSFTDEGRKRLKQLQSRRFKQVVPWVERIIMPGMTLHYVLRKRYIEDYVTQAITEGITQVVNLGAGFDTLLYRLCKQNPDANFIEVDHPNNSDLKKKLILQLNAEPNNMEWVAVDFATQTLEEELNKCTQFKPDKPTLFIAEGVLMYLQETDVERTLSSLRHLITHANMQCLFTCAEPGQYACGPLLKLCLKIKGEPLRWIKERNDLTPFLKNSGYNTQTIMTSVDLKNKYLPENYQGILHDGEYIAVAKCKHT